MAETAIALKESAGQETKNISYLNMVDEAIDKINFAIGVVSLIEAALTSNDWDAVFSDAPETANVTGQVIKKLKQTSELCSEMHNVYRNDVKRAEDSIKDKYLECLEREHALLKTFIAEKEAGIASNE